eukprot:7397471-Karenia_brevis.AAC.1
MQRFNRGVEKAEKWLSNEDLRNEEHFVANEEDYANELLESKSFVLDDEGKDKRLWNQMQQHEAQYRSGVREPNPNSERGRCSR